MDNEQQLKEHGNKDVENHNNSVPSQPECIICATTFPETSFIYTNRTKIGTSLLVFVQKVIKPGWTPKGNLKKTTICKACMNAVDYLESAQINVNDYGDESTDSDSDDEWRKKAKSRINPSSSLISKIESSSRDVKPEGDRKEQKAEDEALSQNSETDRRTEENTTHECKTCYHKFFRYSYGRDLLKENHSDAPLDCLICQRLFTLRSCRRRKPLSAKKPFGCNICRCRFVQEVHLGPHLKAHTRQEPYQCHACELKFDKRLQLLGHLSDCKPCICGIKCFQVLET